MQTGLWKYDGNLVENIIWLIKIWFTDLKFQEKLYNKKINKPNKENYPTELLLYKLISGAEEEREIIFVNINLF